MPFDPACAASEAVAQYDIVLREMRQISDRLLSAAAAAKSLSTATEWRARAAEAFHTQAEQWAGDVSGLYCLAESARLATADARDDAALAELMRCW